MTPKFALFLLFIFSFSLAFSQDDHARKAGDQGEHAVKHGEEAHEEAMPNELWWKWANFAVLAIGLGILAKKVGGPFFSARTEQIQRGIAEASAMRREAEERASEIERRVSNLSAEVDTLRQTSRQEIAAEGERVRQETAQQIAKVQAQAEASIAAAAKNASEDLKSHAAELALQLAEQQIRERLTADSQRNLVDGFVGDLQRKGSLN